MATMQFPLSRIEGHAVVQVDIEAGRATAARFKAMEFRGFEYLAKGAPAMEMPVIMPRICGVCATAHHVAAVKALEDAWGVSPPQIALDVRELLMLGQMLQNQATSIFLFTMPDSLGISSLLPGGGGHQDEKLRELVRKALAVRKTGTELITLAGGQFIHPIKAVVGGVTSGIAPEGAEALHGLLEKELPAAQELVEEYWESILALGERIGTLGDETPAWYLAGCDCTEPNYYGADIHMLSPDGGEQLSFPAQELESRLEFVQCDYSYSRKTLYQGLPLRANSLARCNMAERMGTPLADALLGRFRESFGRPAQPVLLFDLCRCVELLYSMERAMALLQKPLSGEGETVAVPHTPVDGEGYGLVEAPRGPLLHHFAIEDGLIARARCVIPTVHNIAAIEQAVLTAAGRHVREGCIDTEIEHAVGRVARAFDPCIACATH